MGIVRTNKFVSKEIAAALYEQAQAAANTPAMVIGQRYLGPFGKDEATLARERLNEAINEAAVVAGCAAPAQDEDGDTINYGLDFATGEVLAWDGELDGREGELVPNDAL